MHKVFSLRLNTFFTPIKKMFLSRRSERDPSWNLVSERGFEIMMLALFALIKNHMMNRDKLLRNGVSVNDASVEIPFMIWKNLNQKEIRNFITEFMNGPSNNSNVCSRFYYVRSFVIFILLHFLKHFSTILIFRLSKKLADVEWHNSQPPPQASIINNCDAFNQWHPVLIFFVTFQ